MDLIANGTFGQRRMCAGLANTSVFIFMLTLTSPCNRRPFGFAQGDIGETGRSRLRRFPRPAHNNGVGGNRVPLPNGLQEPPLQGVWPSVNCGVITTVPT